MKKIISTVMILVVAFNINACSPKETLEAMGFGSVAEATDELINQALKFAEDISIDDIKQQYVDSGLKDIVHELAKAVDNSYETMDYLVDTSNMKQLYSGEDDIDILSVYMDDNGKVYLLDHVGNKTTVFSGDGAKDFLNTYIEKASGLRLDNGEK